MKKKYVFYKPGNIYALYFLRENTLCYNLNFSGKTKFIYMIRLWQNARNFILHEGPWRFKHFLLFGAYTVFLKFPVLFVDVGSFSF